MHDIPPLAELAAQELAQVFDEEHGDEQRQQHRAQTVVIAPADALVNQDAEAARADVTEDGSGAHVHLKAVQTVGEIGRQNLREHGAPEGAELVRTGGFQRLKRPHVDGFDGFVEHLRHHAEGEDDDGDGARERAQTEHQRADARDHQRRQRADDVENEAQDGQGDLAAVDVRGGRDRVGQRQQAADHAAHDAHLDGIQQRGNDLAQEGRIRLEDLREDFRELVGALGDDVDVKVTFPEEYQAKELAGKEAIFKCAVKKIEAKELPELDDDFAKDVSEFDTLAEYKEHVKTNLEDKKADEAKRAKEDAAVDKAIENAQMDIPEAMLMTQCRQMLDDFSRRMQSQGLSMDQYFQFTGMTAEKMMEDMKPQALKRIQTRLVLEKVAEVENIQPTEEEVNEEISKMAEAYKMEADKLKELLGERELEQMKKDMAVQKAVTVIADAAKEV